MTISSLVSKRELDRFTRHFPAVKGWLSPRAAEVFALIDQIHRLHSVEGDLLEVGAHLGRSSIFMSHLLVPGRTLHVLDIFDQQDLNLSHSAGATYPEWECNYLRWGLPGSQTIVHKGLSQDLLPGLPRSRMRIVYIDGGHSKEDALRDLTASELLMADKGVLVLDDVFNPQFPGVTEGLVNFLDQGSSLVPLITFEGKLLLVHATDRDWYASLFDRYLDLGEHYFHEPQFFCGSELRNLQFKRHVELVSLRLRQHAPLIHKMLSSTDVVTRLFHKIRKAGTR